MSMAEAAEAFSSGRRIHYANYIRDHKGLISPANHVPNNFQHQVIIASICGDGSLSFPYKGRKCNPRISWNMGNREHALYKFNVFNEFVGATYRERENPGFGDNWYCVNTKSHPLFMKYVEKYGERKKNLSVDSGIFDELDSIGWAWLYGDDGHLSREGNVFIHTENFSLDDVNKIAESLNKFIGTNGSRVHSYVGGQKKRLMHCIRLTNGGTYEFFSKIKTHMANGMEYKIR